MKCPERPHAHMEDVFKSYHTQTNPYTGLGGTTRAIKFYYITQLHLQGSNLKPPVKLGEVLTISPTCLMVKYKYLYPGMYISSLLIRK